MTRSAPAVSRVAPGHSTKAQEYSVYLAADAPDGMVPDRQGRPAPIDDDASVRRLWSFEVTDNSKVTFRSINVKKAPVTMNNPGDRLQPRTRQVTPSASTHWTVAARSYGPELQGAGRAGAFSR